MGIDGIEMADQLIRQGSSCPLIIPEPVLGISAKVAREVFRGWTNSRHDDCWWSIRGQKLAKGFLERPSTKKSWTVVQTE
jgi:hypothetical protein